VPTGWIAAHRFLFAGLRCHLLDWPRGLAPDGRRAAFSSAGAPARASPHTICMELRGLSPYAWVQEKTLDGRQAEKVALFRYGRRSSFRR
jgi:hypothetical protein